MPVSAEKAKSVPPYAAMVSTTKSLVLPFQQAADVLPRATAHTRGWQHQREDATRLGFDVGEINEVGSQSRVAMTDWIG